MSGPLPAQDLPLEKTIISLDEKSFTFFYERRDLIGIRIPNSQYILYVKLL